MRGYKQNNKFVAPYFFCYKEVRKWKKRMNKRN